MESNDVDALALACSLDRETAKNLVEALGDWRHDLANAWRPWIELCYVAEAARARCWVGLGHSKSLVHKGKKCRTLDQEALSAAEKAIRDSSPLSDTEFEKRRGLVLSRIDALYQQGKQEYLRGNGYGSAFPPRGRLLWRNWASDPWHKQGSPNPSSGALQARSASMGQASAGCACDWKLSFSVS
jgi:hypothetical protein